MANEMTTPGVAGWIEYSGPDAAKAKKFYRDIIGWNIADMPMQDGSSYSGIMVGEGPIGGFSPVPEDQANWTIYVTVDDVDARTAQAKKAGAQIVSGPADTPGVGRMATIVDPQGARVALITYESMQK